MEARIESVLSQNITLLYERLDLQTIDRNKLRGLFDAQSPPMVIDLPGTLVVTYPVPPLFVQMGENRIRVTFPQSATELGPMPLWSVAAKADALTPNAPSLLTAVGFNYALLLHTSHAKERVGELFIADRARIEEARQGQLDFVAPRVVYRRGDTRYELLLEPVEEHGLKAHLNAHLTVHGTGLPQAQQLEASYRQEYAYLAGALPAPLQQAG